MVCGLVFSSLVLSSLVLSSLVLSCLIMYLSTGRLAEHLGAASAKHNGLRVAEYGRDGEAPCALDIHEEGVRALHQTLQLVLAAFGNSGGMEEILNHGC